MKNLLCSSFVWEKFSNSFYFFIWTAKTIQISKKKELIPEKKKFSSEKKLRMQALLFLCNAFPATKKIHSLNNSKKTFSSLNISHFRPKKGNLYARIVKGQHFVNVGNRLVFWIAKAWLGSAF